MGGSARAWIVLALPLLALAGTAFVELVPAADTLYLIYLHGPQKQEVEVNVLEISTIREPRKDAKGHFAEGVECLLYMTNGQAIQIVESCHAVIDRIKALGATQKPVPDIEKEGR